MQDAYPYERPFRLRILAACLHRNWYASVGYLTAQPEYFNTKQEQALVKFINDYYTIYHRAPCVDEIAAEFATTDELMQELICDVVEILDTKADELEYAKTSAIKFARTQARWVAVNKIVDLFGQGKEIDAMWEVFKEADRVGEDINDMGIDLIKDAKQWLYNNAYEGERIPTGIVHIDKAIGGIGRGEYGLVIGPSGAGKTRTMINYGLGAAGLLSKSNVLHITLEMSARRVAKRYATRLTGRIVERGEEVTFEQELITHAHQKLRGSVRIKQWPNKRLTFANLNRYIDTLAMQDWEPDLIIMDYSTNMLHNQKLDYRHQLSDTSEDLRGLAVERNIGIWDAAQANRTAFRKEIVDLDDISECWDQIATADLVFTVCQTKAEKAEDILRLHAGKIREEESSWLVRCKVDPGLHMIESIEHLTLAEMLELKERNNGKQFEIIK